jgi:hypothetical protein
MATRSTCRSSPSASEPTGTIIIAGGPGIIVAITGGRSGTAVIITATTFVTARIIGPCTIGIIAATRFTGATIAGTAQRITAAIGMSGIMSGATPITRGAIMPATAGMAGTTDIMCAVATIS